MKKKLRIITAAFAMSLIPALAAADVQHVQKQVTFLEPPPDSVDCFYFQLDGVGTADPLFNANPWFAIPRSHKGFKEVYALLLTAKMTSTPVNVVTTGAVAVGCGSYVEVRYVYLP